MPRRQAPPAVGSSPQTSDSACGVAGSWTCRAAVKRYKGVKRRYFRSAAGGGAARVCQNCRSGLRPSVEGTAEATTVQSGLLLAARPGVRVRRGRRRVRVRRSARAAGQCPRCGALAPAPKGTPSALQGSCDWLLPSGHQRETTGDSHGRSGKSKAHDRACYAGNRRVVRGAGPDGIARSRRRDVLGRDRRWAGQSQRELLHQLHARRRRAGAPRSLLSDFVQDQPCDPLDPSCVPFPGLIRVTASGIPGTGFGFDHWTGACSAMNANCQEPVTDDMTATAVFRDTEAPSAGLTASISGTLQRLRADAGDNVGVTQVEFGVRGVRRRTDTRAPYTWSLDTTTIADGPGEITATSFDAAGNSRVTTMNIAVDNSGPTLTIAP